MRNWVIALILVALCTPAHAALLNNPESFEYGDLICDWPPCPPWDVWESWGSGSGSSGWGGWNDQTEIIYGDGTDGDYCLQTSVPSSANWWGYTLAFNHGNPIVPGEIYEYFFDYKLVTGPAVIELEFYDDLERNTRLDVVAWDPYGTAPLNVWQHFSHTFRAPPGAQFVTVVVGATGVGSTMRYDMVGLLPAEKLSGCPYEIAGDEDGDCRVTLADFALLAANWLIDCIDDPADPACVTP